MKTAETKFVVPKGGSVNIEEEMMPDGSRVLTITIETLTDENGCVPTVEPVEIATTENTTCHQHNGIFKKVPASELRLDDAFMKYEPKTYAERKFKSLVKAAIKTGLKDFWRPVYDPSFDDNHLICYEPGNRPAVGKNYNWWKENAKKYAPERGSRLGTRYEYIAFLAVLIKELVASGWTVADAWNSVCNDSKELGHYKNSENAKKDLEATESREICGWYDLSNTRKILAKDNESDGFWLAGGDYEYISYYGRLADLYCYGNRYNVTYYSCGWLVLIEGSTDY